MSHEIEARGRGGAGRGGASNHFQPTARVAPLHDETLDVAVEPRAVVVLARRESEKVLRRLGGLPLGAAELDLDVTKRCMERDRHRDY